MCLYVDLKMTEKMKKGKPNDKIVVWKLLCEYGSELVTPYMYAPVKGGYLKANNISFYKNDVFEEYEQVDNGIHCCRSRSGARNLKDDGWFIVKCWAYRKDLIAADEDDLVFTKIFIPKENLPKKKKKI